MNTEPLIPETTTLAAPDVEALLVKARAIFAGNEQERGTPEVPTQAGFLALARAGKDLWNAWRKVYPEPVPDFTGVDFRGDAAIDFSDFSFTVGGRGKQEKIIFCVDFSACMFGDGTSFDGAQFGDMASFDDAQFGDRASFTAWDVSKIQNFWKSMSGKVAQQRDNFVEARGVRSDAFHGIIFLGSQFHGSVDFQGRIFLSKTYFSLVSFKGIPRFHGCTLRQDTSFYGAEFLAQPSEGAARAYRTLKLAFAQQHAIREEQKFFRLEMEAETGIATGNKKRLYQLYEKMSDYGFSLKRPIKYWLYCLAGFALIYGLLTGTYGWNGNISWERTMQWLQYALLNAVPLPGFDKTLDVLRSELFSKAAIIQLLVTILEIFHKTFGAEVD